MIWFKWFSDKSTEMQILFSEFGAIATGFYVTCAEMISKEVTHEHLSFELRLPIQYMARHCKIELSVVNQMVEMMHDLGMIFFNRETGLMTFRKIAQNFDNSIIKNPQLKLAQDRYKAGKKEILANSYPQPIGQSYPQSGIIRPRLEKNINTNNKKQNTNNPGGVPARSSIKPDENHFCFEMYENNASKTLQDYNQELLEEKRMLDRGKVENVQPRRNMENSKKHEKVSDISIDKGNHAKKCQNDAIKKHPTSKQINSIKKCKKFRAFIALHPEPGNIEKAAIEWANKNPSNTLIDQWMIALKNQIQEDKLHKEAGAFNPAFKHAGNWIFHNDHLKPIKTVKHSASKEDQSIMQNVNNLEQTKKILNEIHKHHEKVIEEKSKPNAKERVSKMFKAWKSQILSGGL